MADRRGDKPASLDLLFEKSERGFVMNRETRTCATKTRYKDKKAAMRVMHGLQVHSTRQSVPNRMYYCNFCRGYHLASGVTVRAI